MKKQKEPAKPLIHSSEPARESGITGRSVIADHRPGSESLSQLRATMQSGHTRPILPQRVPPGGEQQCDYPAGYSYQQNGAVQHSRGAIIQRTGNEDEEKKREEEKRKKLRQDFEEKEKVEREAKNELQKLENDYLRIDTEGLEEAKQKTRKRKQKKIGDANKYNPSYMDQYEETKKKLPHWIEEQQKYADTKKKSTKKAAEAIVKDFDETRYARGGLSSGPLNSTMPQRKKVAANNPRYKQEKSKEALSDSRDERKSIIEEGNRIPSGERVMDLSGFNEVVRMEEGEDTNEERIEGSDLLWDHFRDSFSSEYSDEESSLGQGSEYSLSQYFLTEEQLEKAIKATIPVNNPPKVEGVVANETARDGNCFYYALFEAINNDRGDELVSDVMRQQIVDWLQANGEGIFTERVDLEVTINNIKEDRAWTLNERNVVAASNALGYTIVVHQTEFDQEYVPHNEQSRGIIHLFYNGQNHWSSYTERALD